MAGLTVDVIQREAKSFGEYQKGRSLYYKHMVSLGQVETFWRGEYKITAEAEENRVRLQISDGTIASFSCSCQDGTSRRLCRHAVAAALAWLKNSPQEDVAVKTSPAGTRLIQEYTEFHYNNAVAAGKSRLYLEPKLVLGRKKAELSLRIGQDKMYMIQDLNAFADSVQKQENVTFGKNTVLMLDRSLFEERSRQLCDVITGAMDVMGQSDAGSFPGSRIRKRKQLSLSGALADQVMELLEGELVATEEQYVGNNSQNLYGYLSNQVSGTKQVKQEDPRIPVRFLQKGSDGIHMELPGNLFVFRGAKRLYVSYGDAIYCCSPEYTKAVGLFLDSLVNRGYPECGKLDINEKDMPVFCRQVLFAIQEYLDIQEEDVTLRQYYPERLVTKCYLDEQPDGMLTCRLLYCYGEQEIDPLAEQTADLSSASSLQRDEAEELLVFHAISRYFFRSGEGQGLVTPDADSAWRFLTEGLPVMQTFGEVYVTDRVSRVRTLQSGKNRIGVSLEGDLLNLELDLEQVDPAELMAVLDSYRQKRSYHRLKNGDFLNLKDETLSALDDLTGGLELKEQQLQQGILSVPSYRAMYVEDVLQHQNSLVSARNRAFRNLAERFEQIHTADLPIPDGIESILRPYQKEGFYWLKALEQYGFHGILADDMGLGKTLQVIALLLARPEGTGPSLVVCPASLLYNWEHEFGKFAPELQVLPITGNAEERQALLQQAEGDLILITSYELLRRDETVYGTMEFDYMILDEAQYIKNHTTLNAKTVKQMQAAHRVALTGTPIENRLSELWSIFDFLMPGFLYPYGTFRKEYEIPIVKEQDEKALARFRRMTRPFILRRLKGDVLQDLPPKTEETVMTVFSGTQKQLYQASVLKLRNQLEHQTTEEYNKNQIQILAQLTRLRRLCCDPRLCLEGYADGSAKLDTCMELVQSSVESGHKLLLFSQFTGMLELMEERLRELQIAYYKLTGSTSKEERQRLVDQFQQDDTPVFLISLKAGGTGLNLTAADIVIHYDPWWNVAAQNQATDRTHRIGQAHPVTVYKLVAKGTIEEQIVKLQERKYNLAEQILEGLDDSLHHLSKEELLEIL